MVASSSTVTRCGVTFMLSSLPAVSAIRAFDDVAEAIAELREGNYDLVITTTEMEPAEYFPLRDLARRRNVKLLSLLHGTDDKHVDCVTAFEADGYLVERDLTAQGLENAVRRLADGEMILADSLAHTLLARLHHADRARMPHSVLTRREQQTLRLVVDGLSNKQIATRLGISEHGAKRHVASLLAKMNCPNRTHAAALALREGLLD
ncbi:MAG TPA: response regulator transcription factor [Streptosporangiaceae bacterium]|nr:response regulator transcription factor [Streptosporangiaceae bacterium]